MRSSLVRQRFGHSDACPVGEVEGQAVRATQLTVRTMNFGQHWRTAGVREVAYSLSIPVPFVADLVNSELPSYVEDCIKFPDVHPFEDALRRKDWPTAEQILGDPELRALAVDYFAHDCLLRWFGDGEPVKTPGYVINSAAFEDLKGDGVYFKGIARTAEQPIRYQDV